MEDSYICCLCHSFQTGIGNNPAPLVTGKDAICCDDCNKAVCLVRINIMKAKALKSKEYNKLKI
jgi:hypothetical protein